MAKAKWSFVSPTAVGVSQVKGGTMVMAVAAKKHVTVFARSRHAPGAGSPSIKAKFASAARGTRGIKDRMERNARIAGAF